MVSVIIPVYQVSDYIERCIRSVMTQTFTDIECIIVDDSTEDDSIEKCKRIIKDYEGPIRFRILHHEKNRGLSAARNTGIDAASGEYIYFLDGDDEITPDCIEKLVSKVMEDDSIEMVQGSHVRINNGKKELFVSENIRIVGNDEVRNQFLKWRNINYCAWNKLLKRSFIVKNDLYFREGVTHEELLWTFYLIKYLKSAWLCEDITYHYMLRPGSIVTGKSLEEKGMSEVKVYDEILHNLTVGKERDELYGFLYNFCEVLANYLRCTPELKGIQRYYKHLAWRYGCCYEFMVLTLVYAICRYVNPMQIFLPLNKLRWSIRNLLFLLVLFLPMTLKAAVPTGSVVADSLSKSTPDTIVVCKKHPWLAGLEITGFNIALVGLDRLLFKDREWIQINMEQIKQNLTHSYWSWDQDDLGVNALRHPIHGSLFYLIARANNMSIGESSLYTLGGSWMWEMFCEAEKPSINDMVYTTVGGITIGETLWRSGKSILNMFKKGVRKQQDGPFATSLTVGYRNFEAYNTKAVHTAFLTWEATYGDMFDATKRGPFDNFEVSGTLVLGDDQRYVSDVHIDHQIVSKPVVDESVKKVVTGLYNHFDYVFASPLETLKKHVPKSYSYSEVGAIGPGIAYRLGEHTRWEQQLYVNGIMMGAVPEYNYHKDSRGYSFGSGYGARLYSKFSIGSWLRMGVRAQFSHLFTWDGFYEDDKSKSKSPDMIQGEQGNALTAIVAPTIEVKPFKHFALQCSGWFMHTHLNYTYHPHTSTHAWEWQVGLKYIIGN